MDTHPDLAAETAYLEHADRCLDVMRARTEWLATVDAGVVEVDNEAARMQLRTRLRTLAGGGAIAFGRLDEETGDQWYIGRRHVEDARGETVVVDWRAPVSIPFYRATAVDPMELVRRRRFVLDGARLVDLLDEVFDDPDTLAHAAGIPDPLLSELERARTGEMRDIVATIQAEQDVVIRAPLAACLVVQGGPGTGKTAVGLHRAAFLLYEHRELLGDDGVLVVGPNPVFLRYVGQVLPSLGETAVRQATVEQLVGGPARAVEARDVARLKGDARMAPVLTRACNAKVVGFGGDLVVETRWGRVKLDHQALDSEVQTLRAGTLPHNQARRTLRARLERLAYRQHVELRGVARAADPEAFGSELRALRPWTAALDRAWPSVTGPALLRRLFGNAAARRVVANGVLDTDEQQLLDRRPTRRAGDERWTLADLALLDEAQALTNGMPRAYGHLVVDEAQDISAMEWRALGRRCPDRSMTVLGDLAQATAPGAQARWDDVVTWLGDPDHAQLAELSLGYRVPAPILEFANRLLVTAAPGVRPSRSVRVTGRAPVVLRVEDRELAARVAGEAARLAGAYASVGIVVPEALAGQIADALTHGAVPFDDARRSGIDHPVTVLEPLAAKGLEFDAVIVVEPTLVAVGDAGARLLYVALTRAVQELVVVGARPLPHALSTEGHGSKTAP